MRYCSSRGLHRACANRSSIADVTHIIIEGDMMAGPCLPRRDLSGWRQTWEEGQTLWHKAAVDPVLEVTPHTIIVHALASFDFAI